MPKDSNTTKRYGPNNLTRKKFKRPLTAKKWFGRVAMREAAKVLERVDETVRAFEIREARRAKKRDTPKRVWWKFIREQNAAEEAYYAHYRNLAAKRKRDANGRFV